MIELVWTKGKWIDLIAWWIGEPVSHFAVAFNESMVIHSTIFKGVHAVTIRSFLSTRKVVYKMEIGVGFDRSVEIFQAVSKHHIGKSYDYGLFAHLFWQGFRKKFLGKKIEKSERYFGNNVTLCQEVIGFLPGDVRPEFHPADAITPYGLFLSIGKHDEDGNLTKGL